jgi:Helix-turn-helix
LAPPCATIVLRAGCRNPNMIGVCHQQIQKYENGTDRLAASTAVDLAEQFGVTVDELLGLNGIDDVLAKPVRKNLEPVADTPPVDTPRSAN